MSPASRSKSKDKPSARATKEQQQKASSKPSSAPVNAAAGVPASAYDPISGTFHTLEIAPTISSPPPQNNGRFRTIDETDDHSGSSLGTGAEYDSISNNDSCSGESEDQKEKTATTATRLEAIPGCDNDKRDKIRQKNERKHQRQRERRAQELRERCNGYLMARKLETLAQQILGMGFKSELVTMALILNEGRTVESVDWLCDKAGLEEEALQQYNIDSSAGPLKIDIAEELTRIADMEIKYKCSRQDVERALVACEGDLDKAGETLRAAQKQELPKPEGTGDPPAINSGKPTVSATQNPSRTTQLPKASTFLPNQQRRETERDSNYTKVATLSEPGNRNLHSSRKSQQKTEWARPQATTEKKWPNPSTSPSVSYPLASPPPYTMSLPLPSAKSEARYVLLGTEGSNKNMHTAGTLREPVIMMQRPQSVNAKQNSTASFSGSSPPCTSGWYPNGATGVECAKTNNLNLGQRHIPNTNNVSSNQYYQQTQLYQPFGPTSVDSSPTAGWGSSSSRSVPSSLGLFTGWGSAGPSGSSSPVDWSMGGSMPVCDYTNIDWSVESSPTSSKSGGLWLGLASYGKGGNGRVYDTWSVASAGVEGSVTMTDTSSAGSHEWTSPFAGKDLLSIPRQFVTTSPSLTL
eukprot:TRINITY_DN9165_c1_g2_i1.p1 TRINITY_DN9165_c1_g2~~TRINITY_DN9165_c1_g2_i1.p1  ORF type:complete len:637 (+),score=110.24 TRINITY_DN9165_c1_g2_i1:461-2371(+)